MLEAVVKCGVLFLAVLLCTSPLGSQSRPMGGKFQDTIYSLNASSVAKINGTCHMMGLYNGSTISVTGKLSISNKNSNVELRLVAKLYKLRCANLLQMEDDLFGKKSIKPCERNGDLEGDLKGFVELKAVSIITRTLTDKEATFKFDSSMTEYVTPPPPPLTTTAAPVKTTPPPADKTKPKREDTAQVPSNATTAKAEDESATPVTTPATTLATIPAAAEPTKGPAKPSQKLDKKEEKVMTVGRANESSWSGIYLLQVYVERLGGVADNKKIRADVHIEMRNPHGYLSAIDYPALVFYGVMTTVYSIFAIVWIVLMLCSFNDLVRLQFWVLAVIILGFLEKTFFVAEYSAINLGNDTYGSYIIAEFVSAVKRGLSRMLLIIVAMGFGTVKPRLGDSLFKVVAAGVAYFVLALIDGIMRARTDTFHTSDTSSVVTLALLLLLDTFIFYWIFTAIVDTRRTLRLRKNYVKLSMYNHFAYTLIFAIIATVGFITWVFVALEYPSEMCLTDWREVWLRDCFWHVLFAFILLVIMIIWRPSSNRSRFAYSLVTDADDDEVLFEQGNNKNFDTVKMRSVSKPDSASEPPPPVTSKAEDDLRWVEENLPTTAMDKALPLLLDSDEEVMTTKFEVSKMN